MQLNAEHEYSKITYQEHSSGPQTMEFLLKREVGYRRGANG